MSDPLLAFELKLLLALLAFPRSSPTRGRPTGASPACRRRFRNSPASRSSRARSPSWWRTRCIRWCSSIACCSQRSSLSRKRYLRPSSLPRGKKPHRRASRRGRPPWLAGAHLITNFRAAIPGAPVLLIGAIHLRDSVMLPFWTKAPHSGRSAAGSPAVRSLVALRHRPGQNSTGLALDRLLRLLMGACSSPRVPRSTRKWVGMASALPLPGFFVLAALMDDAEQSRDPAARTKSLPIRDTLFSDRRW